MAGILPLQGEASRIVRFVVVGGLCTLVAYAVFVSLVPRVHYQAANVIAWACSVGVGFLLNRYFTFRISSRDKIWRHLMLFIYGSLGQLALSSALYGVFLGWMELSTTLAFVLTTGVGAVLMFAWLKLVTFR